MPFGSKLVHIPYGIPTWSKMCMFTVFCSMLLFCWGFATQSIDPNEEAQKYHDADLVIIGNVVAYATNAIQGKGRKDGK